ncbi:MAG: hypothetical protein II508_01250, partial [Acholeplasmatales bacterium]|nr:hypothetical protein [Acholeplasmatales bacterium]
YSEFAKNLPDDDGTVGPVKIKSKKVDVVGEQTEPKPAVPAGSPAEQNDLIELVDVFIHQTRDGIMKAQFDIAPKRIKGNDVSCTFCKYKDICFKKYEDYVFLEEKKFGSEVE